jgi:N-acetyl sugar amidotransferase
MTMIYCISCLLPETKPDLSFDSSGVCAACLAYKNRKQIDWKSREEEFFRIIDKFRTMKKNSWDCIVPVSGGKDSTAQVLKMLELGLNPLAVNSRTCDLSSLGRANLENIMKLGVDCIEVSPKPNIRRRINKFTLEKIGDIAWPEHVGIFTIPVRVALMFDVPLIIWGENSQNEYGGPVSSQNNTILDRRWLEEFGGLIGLRVTDLIDSGEFEKSDLELYLYPDQEDLNQAGVTGLFLGQYFPWDGLSNALIAKDNGFKSFDRIVEGSFVDYENLDNYQHGIHDYFKFLKYGYGRATDIASIQIRRGLIERQVALEAVKELEGGYPWTYLGKNLNEILNSIDMNLPEFDLLCEKFTNKNLFKLDHNGELIKSKTGNLIKVNYDN